MAPHLYLIRHGETAWSLSGQHTGRTELPLTARGEDEARELSRRLEDTAFTRILTSPRLRARRTCELAGLSEAAEIEPDLAEWDYGAYEGRRSDEIRKERPGWDLFRDGCPHGELPARVAERADRLISRLRAFEGNVALFSHSQFGSVLAARWIGLAVEEARHLPLGTASISILGHDPHHPDIAILALWNETSKESLRRTSGQGPGRGIDQAIERWENEGGISPPAPTEALSTEIRDAGSSKTRRR